MEFAPLCSLNLSEEGAAMLYYELRTALERMLPNNMVDACDYEVLTVFPFKRGECSNAPDDYEVENYEVGMYGTQPALHKMEEDRETILVLDEELGGTSKFSMPYLRPISKLIEKNAATTD
ncbi:MAG: hypothetical protein IIX50_00195 [Bacteroidaceae bacterium]|nr:hypothetical protein [Bacteroidaceae bacterium]